MSLNCRLINLNLAKYLGYFLSIVMSSLLSITGCFSKTSRTWLIIFRYRSKRVDLWMSLTLSATSSSSLFSQLCFSSKSIRYSLKSAFSVSVNSYIEFESSLWVQSYLKRISKVLLQKPEIFIKCVGKLRILGLLFFQVSLLLFHQ
jgi:hypothetical protein